MSWNAGAVKKSMIIYIMTKENGHWSPSGGMAVFQFHSSRGHYFDKSQLVLFLVEKRGCNLQHEKNISPLFLYFLNMLLSLFLY